MDYSIIPVKTHPFLRPSQPVRLLQRSLRKVKRWEDPLEAELIDLNIRLIETQEMIKWALVPIHQFPNGGELPDEIMTIWASMTSIPPKAAGQLEMCSSSRSDNLQASHLRLLRQCHFLEGNRRQIRAAERTLTEHAFIDSMYGQAVVTQMRGLYHTTYEQLVERGIDGQSLDSMLDARPVDLVEWLLEQRLYQALRAIYGMEWFRCNGLARWLSEQKQIEETQSGFPAHPIGNEAVFYTDLATLSHAVFDTQLKAAALFGNLARNWYVSPDALARLLFGAMQNTAISERGGEKLIAAIGLALEPVDKGKFETVHGYLKREYENIFS